MPDEGLSSAPAAAPAAAGGGGSAPSAPATSSGGIGAASPAASPAFGSPDPGLRPLDVPSFQEPEQAPAALPDDQAVAEAAPEEFPGDDQFSQLSGEERQSHWSQARQRIADLNQQVSQANDARSLVQDWGGVEQVRASLDLLTGLIAPITDEQGQIVYGADGLPETSSEAFWSELRERSPQTFVQAGEDWLFQEHSPGLANWQVAFTHVFGLDPNKLEIYRSIQNAADAAQYQPASDIPSWELEEIPAELHDAYKATEPDMREQLQSLTPATRDKYLQEKQAFLEERQSRQMRDQQAQQAHAMQQQQEMRRLEGEAANHAMQFRQSQRQSLKDELARSFSPTADQAINDRIRERCLDLTEHYVNNDPQIGPLVAQADRYMREAYKQQIMGDQVKAAQANYIASNASQRALAMARKYLSDQVAFENARSTGFREGWDQKREQARGRTVLPRSEASGLPSGSFGPRVGASPFSNERYGEIARQLQQQRQVRSEGY